METLIDQPRAAPAVAGEEWEQRIRANLGLVRRMALELARRAGRRADLDELISAGTVGLIEALQAFDPERGYAFSTFAVPRIRGAMFDELRRQEGAPRSTRRKRRQIVGAQQAFIREHQRAPDERELAGSLGIGAETLSRWRADVEGMRPMPLDHLPAGYVETERGSAVAAAMTAGACNEVEERINREEEVGFLRDALLALGERERLVITLHYYEGLKLSEIAQVLEVSGARVSQIHAAALATLRRRMRRIRAA